MRFRFCALFALAFLVLQSCDHAQQYDQETPSKLSFNDDIRPILNKNCTGCHGGVTKQGGVSFVYEDQALGRGNSGRLVIVPGDAEASELYQRIVSKDPARRMPYKKGPMKEQDIALLKQWIDEGATWEDPWSFEMPVAHEPPSNQGDWAKGKIDAFVFAQMQKRGLTPEAETKPEQWLRRVSLDLIGIQPSEAELNAFLSQLLAGKDAEKVYQGEVERLLASPRFGERWAAMWMDLARYADSKGYEKDRHRETWPYRDWVIEAFNSNMPYDQFLVKQLAGDLLPNASFGDYAATLFSRLTSTNDEGGTDDEEYRVIAAMDRNATLWSVYNGITMNCVQCHDHPYDPIPHQDYFHSLAFFNTSRDADNDYDSPLLKFAVDKTLNDDLFERQKTLFDLEKNLVEFARSVSTDKKWQPMTLAEAHVDFNTSAFLSAQAKDLEWKARPEDERIQIEWCHQRELAKKAKKPLPKAPNSKVDATYCDGQYWVTKWWYLGYLGSLEQSKEYKTSPKDVEALELVDGRFNEAKPKLPPNGNYRFLTEAAAAPYTLSALKFQVSPFDLEKSAHTPQNGFNIDHISVELVQNDGAVRSLPVELFLPDSGFGVSTQVEKLAKHKNGNVSLPSEWYAGFRSHRIFYPVHTVAKLQQAVEIQKGERLRLSFGQLQMGMTSDGKPYYLRNLAVSYTDDVDTDFNPFTELQQNAVEIKRQVLSIEGKEIPVMREQFAHEFRSTPMFDRGNATTKVGPDLKPNSPAAFAPLNTSGDRATRLDLAKWFVSDEQPLTSRVAVNRFWEQLFGRGLVLTLEDFGGAGVPPTHPKLLDWMALRFQHELDWDVKALLKEITLSATYRQNAEVSSEKIEQDPSNVWLARGPRQRLSAEMVRDQALSAAGLLSEKMGGPSVMPPQPDGVWQQRGGLIKWITPEGEDRYRRAIYTYIKRSSLYPSLAMFDDTGHLVSSPRRIPTNTPLQALVTLNDPVFFEAASVLASALEKEEQVSGIGAALDKGLMRIISRPASQEEKSILKTAFNNALELHQRESQKNNSINHRVLAWTDVAVAMLNMHASLVR